MNENQQEETKDNPNESSGVHLQGFVKISDPETKEVFFEGRA